MSIRRNLSILVMPIIAAVVSATLVQADETLIADVRDAAPENANDMHGSGERSEGGERSVKPGINARFLDPELDVSEWIARFEIESREVFLARQRVLDALHLKPGMRIADIGAGTGFYSRLFSEAVGDAGWVYAADISPRFLEHINEQSKTDNVGNITSVLCTDRSVKLPPNSVDAAFVCDTYHHFEYPQLTLASIRSALKPDGILNVIDFERIPGKSSDFILSHVRAGKDVFQGEILDAGFELVEEVKIPSFRENYFLRFRIAELKDNNP